LARPDDIFFLTVTELQAIVEAGTPTAAHRDIQACVANRRLAYDYWLTVVAPDAIGSDGKPIIEEKIDINSSLEGIAASGGRVRGTARVVLNPHEVAQLHAGEILVTQATDLPAR